MNTEQLNFPNEFTWGAATSSYQIEGAVNADGRGESIWDRYCNTPGMISDGTNGDIACDHYNLWPDDIQLMQQLGLNAYRFSIAWPRILPTGRGTVNQTGIDFYSRLVDGLLAAGIAPYATLYHWDLPQVLEDLGGWPVRATADAFVEYADVMTRALGDRVQQWATFNEPAVSSWVGYWMGRHAPGRKNAHDAMAAAHHILLAHGKAVPVMRNNVPNGDIGIVVDIIPYEAASESEADKRATALEHARQNRFFVDPLAGKPYPQETAEQFASDMAFVQAGDMATIAVPIDFVGINYYRRYVIRDENSAENLPQTVFYNDEITNMGWEVRAQSLTDALNYVHDANIAPRIFITENGAAYDDEVSPDGTVDDPKRVSYFQSHLAACSAAIEQGVPLAGYFAWSLLDNFEWGFGYTMRFGIIHVDFETQQRTLKNSALFYRDVIAANTIS